MGLCGICVGLALRLRCEPIGIASLLPFCLFVFAYCQVTTEDEKASRGIQSLPITIHEVWQMMDKYVIWVFQALTSTICATQQQKLISVSS